MGSSPQARGTPSTFTSHGPGEGLIPAGAGNTTTNKHRPLWKRAHPRRRGEHISGLSPRRRVMGSSPQARGTLSTHATPSDANGLIPAGAGNTKTLLLGSMLPWAHPRRRGEHWRIERHAGLVVGSSPQARGTQPARAVLRLWRGLIPAGAGNTWTGVTCASGAGAHPRRRGEHISELPRIVSTSGSSPQARGTPRVPVRQGDVAGLIPAGAGNTWETLRAA